jgi:hypothetical protein
MNREDVAKAIRFIEGMPEGQLLIGYLLNFCHVFQTSMPETCDPNMTLFNEGQRSVGNEIVALLVNEPSRFKAETLRRVTALSEGKDL